MPTLAIGSIFAGYVIDQIVARGGMGVVYQATQSQPQRRVALKLIAPEYAADAGYRERFLREADLLASLDDCPSIVPIYAAGEADGQLYLVMRFLDGPDLATLLKQGGPLPLARTAEILGPVAAALDAAHEAGLVHRDVKPSNIMLDRRSAVYLMDFGLTKRADSDSGLTRPGQAIGTAGYMAPEQFTGRATDPALAARIDIYALGCVLHACLTGEEPYPRDSYEQSLFAHVYDSPPKVSQRRPDVPAPIDDIVARALAKDPHARFERASDLAHAVRDIARSVAAASAPDSTETSLSSRGDVPPPPERRRIPGSTRTAPRPAMSVQPSTVVVNPPRDPARVVPGPGAGPAGMVPSARSLIAGLRGQNPVAIGAAAFVLIIGALGFLLSRGPSETGSGTAAPRTPAESEISSPSAGMPSEAPSTVPSANANHGSPQDVAALIATLPTAVASTCVSAAMYASGAIADVQCSRPDGGLVWYTRFSDSASMLGWYAGSVRLAGLAPDTMPCGEGAECETTWQYQSDATVDIGRIVCYVNDDGQALVDFTIDANLTMGSLFESSGNLKSLYEIWAAGDVIPSVSG